MDLVITNNLCKTRVTLKVKISEGENHTEKAREMQQGVAQEKLQSDILPNIRKVTAALNGKEKNAIDTRSLLFVDFNMKINTF